MSCTGDNLALGRTALHIAVEKRRIQVAKALCKQGADLRARDNRGRTPMDIAEEQDNVEMKETLQKVSGCSMTVGPNNHVDMSIL